MFEKWCSSSITNRWTRSSSFDVRKTMFVFVRCSIKWCWTHHYYTLQKKNPNVDSMKIHLMLALIETKFKITCLIFINAFNFKILRNLSTIWCLVVNWKPIIHFSWMVFSIGTEAKKIKKNVERAVEVTKVVVVVVWSSSHEVLREY